MLEITQSAPGRRFQDRYRRKHAENGSAWKRCAYVCAGVLLTIVGVILLAFPGPGILVGAVGLALIAQESVTMARWLDRTELRLRRWWKKLRR